jgi:hypothetical protein
MATRIVLEDVWYSNALPEWYTPEDVDHDARGDLLLSRATRYLNGASPQSAFHVSVPKINGGARSWVVPSVNDQIIFHACVEELAPKIEQGFDHARIYSCKRNDDANKLAFLEPQAKAFTKFVNDTRARLSQGLWVLEIDLLEAFRSVRLRNFLAFVQSLSPGSPEAALIAKFTSTWSVAQPGIPFLNDSMFFLGNAYLKVVDHVVDRFTRNYIRFADDYRVFARNRTEAEALYERINGALQGVNLRINPRKVRVVAGSNAEDGFAAVGNRWDPAIHGGEYIRSLVMEPAAVSDLTRRVLVKPERYLNEGVGRLLLGAYRRFSLDRAIARREGLRDNQSGQFTRLLLSDPRMLGLIADRLSYFSNRPGDTWRTIWMIYLIEQIGQQQRFQSTLQKIENNRQFAPATRLWARRCRLGKHGEPERLPNESLHDLDYVEAGRRCYGDNLCSGEGF